MAEVVLVTGGSGLLALNWAVTMRTRAAVALATYDREVALAGVATRRTSLDAIDELARAFDALEPTVVIHTAGIASVEACEADERLAYYVNVELAANVADACAKYHIPLVHISTDHLFRGVEAFATEADPVSPVNVYGRTKAAAERRVLDVNPDALVVRTNFYGWGPHYRRSFSDRIIDALRDGSTITLFTDVFFTPILAEALCLAVEDLVRLKCSGIVNVCGSERLSKYSFGVRLAERFGLDERLIRPGCLANHIGLVQRPFDMSLSNALACQKIGQAIGTIDSDLSRLFEQEQLGIARELQNA